MRSKFLRINDQEPVILLAMKHSHTEIRSLYNRFWEEKNHKEVPPIPLVPQNDPTTLFTGSGMQQLVPNLLGQPHPLGARLYNIQPCFRAQDIEEIGDNRHTTFFEMMGNWSFGDYFKKEQLSWFWDFLTKELNLPKERLYVTIFAGTKEIEEDKESFEIWKSIGIPQNKILKYGPEKNWWSRAGIPEIMPIGEPGGPDSEVFYDFGEDLHFHENSKFHTQICHPNCDCGRFLEIGNSVFMQYKKEKDGSFTPLPKMNVDFGGGLERILAAVNNDPDIFKTDIYYKIIQDIEKYSNKSYEGINKSKMRVIADHLKAASLMAQQGIEPSNKEQGYVMRRLIRRAVVKMMELDIVPLKILRSLCESIVNTYNTLYFKQNDTNELETIIGKEIKSFEKTVHKSSQILQSQNSISGKVLFDLKQSYGLPIEVALELLEQWGKDIDKIKVVKEYQDELEKHKILSRTTSIGKFKGGLGDNNEQTIKFHTATHLIHQALLDVLGSNVRQEGSNITGERLRFDFYCQKKPENAEIIKVQEIVNKKINDSLSVSFKIIPKIDAEKLGAKSYFREKYPDMVKVYFIDDYSKEFCGGPHVKNTKEIGKVEIYKFEPIGSNLYRIYAK